MKHPRGTPFGGVWAELAELLVAKAPFTLKSLTFRYLRLIAVGLASPASIAGASDEALLWNLNGDRAKLAIVRHAATSALERSRLAATVATPVLRPYEP